MIHTGRYRNKSAKAIITLLIVTVILLVVLFFTESILDEVQKEDEFIFTNNSTIEGNGLKGTPLIMLDGEEIDSLKVNPANISQVEVLKDEKAIEKYGYKAKDGAIIIITKK
jgi:hypothetical protein